MKLIIALLSPLLALLATAHAEDNFAAQKEALLDYLHTVSADGRFLAGTQVNEYEVFLECDSMDRLVAATGEEQAILGLELMFAQAYKGYEDHLVDHAVAHARRGGLVTLAWHQRNPIKVCPRGEFYDCSKTPLSAAELDRVLTPGTRENELWRTDVAAAAKTLKRFEDEGILVLFRPYHEMSGDWFWWGRQERLPDLWDALYDELVTRHGRTNLVWVWSGDRAIPDATRYWPKRHLPDITGTDVYENDNDSGAYAEGAATARSLSPDSVFAFTEVGRVPSAAVLAETRPAWVLVWGGDFLNADWAQTKDPCTWCNTAEETAAFFSRETLVTLTDMPMELRRKLAGSDPAPLPQRPHCPASLLETGE